MLVYDKKEKNIYYTLCVLLNKINNHLLNEELSKYNYIKNNCNYLSNITIKLYNENITKLIEMKNRLNFNKNFLDKNSLIIIKLLSNDINKMNYLYCKNNNLLK